MINPNAQKRPLHEIAREISLLWRSTANYAAKPYIDAMHGLDRITENYGFDSAESIVRYFLSNARSWRGEEARRIKAELREMLK